MARTMPVPCTSSLNIFNLRELLEKSLEECELGLTSSALTNLATGTLFSRTPGCSLLSYHGSYFRTPTPINWQHIKNAIRKRQNHLMTPLIPNYIHHQHFRAWRSGSTSGSPLSISPRIFSLLLLLTSCPVFSRRPIYIVPPPSAC